MHQADDVKPFLGDLITENISDKVHFGVFGPGTQPVIFQAYLSSKNKAFVQQNLLFLWLLVYLDCSASKDGQVQPGRDCNLGPRLTILIKKKIERQSMGLAH